MKLILRNPPLIALLMAIALDLPVQRSPERRSQPKQGWFSRQIDRFWEWRESLARRA